jgi:Flp pilus assembly protein TadD
MPGKNRSQVSPKKPGWRAVAMPLGLALLAAGCTKQVRTAHAPVTAPPPTVWDKQIANARDAGEGDYQLRVLRQKVAAEPDNLTVRLELAQAYRDRGYSDVALEMTRLAAARFPASGEAELALARALRQSNRREEATASLQSFAQVHPDAGPEFQAWLGILLDEGGQRAAAEGAHRKAVEGGPANDSLRNNLGYNLLMQEKYADAAVEFRKALELNPKSEMARNNLGLALVNLGQPQEAIAVWQAGADAATAHNNLAAVYIEKGRYPEARKELEIALGYNRVHPAALKNLELVSRMDGKQATLALKTEGSFWKRLGAGIMRAFVRPSQESRTDTAKTTSVSPSGEER